MKKAIILIVVYSLVCTSGYTQNIIIVDSLKQVIANFVEPDTNQVKVLINIGNQYKFNVPDTALIYYDKALKIANNINAKELAAKSLKNIGTAYYYQSNYKKASEYWLKALKINEEIDDKKGIAANLGNIGIAYDCQSDYVKALEFYNKALKINTDIGNKSSIAINLVNIGIVLTSQSEYTKALEYYKKALIISEEIGNKNSIASNMVNIGIVYENKEDFSKALAYYKKALKINKEIGEKSSIANNLVNIASVYNAEKEYYRAINYAKKSLVLSKEIGALSLERGAYSHLANAYVGVNNYKKAIEYKDLWIELNDSIFNTEKIKAIADMQTKYETEKKEKQILKQQTELKTSQLETAKQRIQRNMFIVAFGLMILLVIIVLRSYRQKKKANILLAKQKQEIALANSELNQQNEEITAQRDEIVEQKNIVEKAHIQISHSIDYAKRLQQSILPENKVLSKYLSEYFVLFKPKDKVSGDFYWWSHTNNHTVITAVDCTGHGVPGAFMSMLGGSFLREIVQKEFITNTGEILQRLRNEVIKALKQKGEMGEQKDGMDMAIISIDHKTNIVQFSGANNQLYILSNNERNISGLESLKDFNGFYEIKPNKMPIAIFHKMGDFTTHEVQLEKGDQLFMFSDGYADQFGGPKYRRLTSKLLKNILAENKNKPMDEQKELLIEKFDEWKENNDQIDDVLILGVKI